MSKRAAIFCVLLVLGALPAWPQALGMHDPFRNKLDRTPPNAITPVSLSPSRDPGQDATTISVTQMQVPDRARALLLKAAELLSKHQIDKARKAALKALKVYPRYAEAHALLGLLAWRGKQAALAISEMQEAVRLDPYSVTSLVELGSVYNSLGRHDDALQVLGAAFRLAPHSWQVHFETGRAYLGKREFSRSLAAAEKAIKLSERDFPPLHLLRGSALLALNQMPAAEAEFEKYLGSQSSGEEAAQARHAVDRLRAATATQAGLQR